MKSAWQYVYRVDLFRDTLTDNSVYNMKRKIASLQPISQLAFDTQVRPTSKPSEKKDNPAPIQEAEEESDDASPYQCLFCQQKFDEDSDGLQTNLNHMSTVHGLFVPDPTLITDLESFLGYLATEVREWHECLYCGTTRDSTFAIQSHMRDRGHCKLNLERESELWEFWEERSEDESSVPARTSGKELTLSPGQSAPSRLAQQKRAKASRGSGTSLALRAGSSSRDPPQVPKAQGSRQLARRDEMGMLNIGPNNDRHWLWQ